MDLNQGIGIVINQIKIRDNPYQSDLSLIEGLISKTKLQKGGEIMPKHKTGNVVERYPPRLPYPAGYTLREVELILGWHQTKAYRLAQEGKLEVFITPTGTYNVSEFTVMKLLEAQQETKNTGE